MGFPNLNVNHVNKMYIPLSHGQVDRKPNLLKKDNVLPKCCINECFQSTRAKRFTQATEITFIFFKESLPNIHFQEVYPGSRMRPDFSR